MTKTRRVGGNATYIVRGTTKEFANEIEINSNGRIEYNAPEYTYGEPEARPITKEPQKAFSGWWSPDYEGISNIPEQDANWPKAYLEETVYFQLNVSESIPVGTSITFQLWDKDNPFNDLTIFDDGKFDGKSVFKTAMVREVNGQHRITIELYLNPKWQIDIKKDEKASINGCLEFYWTWKYHNTYWKSKNNILDVYPSKTTLFIKPAYEGYGFPEIRSADGEIIVFSAGIVATEEPSKELENVMDKICENIKNNAMFELREEMVKYSDKLRFSIAIKQLKKGHLVNNMGKLEYSRRIYTKPVFDNGGELYEITQAANFGYKKEGKLITTKGISQLDYFKQVGVRNAILKNAEKLNFFINSIDIVKFGMDGKMETLTTMFVPLDFLNAVVYPSISKPIEKVWDNIVVHDVEKAKDIGIRGIYELARSEMFNTDRYGDYKCLEIDQKILDKLLKGEIKTLKELTDLKEKHYIESNYDKSKFIFTLLHYTKEDENTHKYLTYVDTIFIN
ncbi:hypothetical protein LPB248_01215 [Flavobacterium sp. LPB0248]|uniref:hypothetical protein n=1 Tax=Flavobacterium sp. LPB0248 TaxID=2614441 RepID=UPI0015A6912A|nr:hypothetical protein [Flavobacterium sp. LPB0248]QLC64942.1 hypothetical protein LPB248_01215 [Flavobacterium sp. LPB0248]